MDLPDPPVASLADAPAARAPRATARPLFASPPALGVWKGRAWELGLMLAAAGWLACLTL